jgi:hypothetical protein
MHSNHPRNASPTRSMCTWLVARLRSTDKKHLYSSNGQTMMFLVQCKLTSASVKL